MPVCNRCAKPRPLDHLKVEQIVPHSRDLALRDAEILRHPGRCGALVRRGIVEFDKAGL